MYEGAKSGRCRTDCRRGAGEEDIAQISHPHITEREAEYDVLLQKVKPHDNEGDYVAYGRSESHAEHAAFENEYVEKVAYDIKHGHDGDGNDDPRRTAVETYERIEFE